VILATVLAWWPIHLNPASVSYGRLQWLGLLLTLNYWTRLDSALISAMIAGAVIVRLLGARCASRTLAARALAIGAWPFIGAIGYAGACLTLTGTIVPVSGLAKTHYASQHFAEYGWTTSLAGHVYWWAQVQARPIVDAASTAILAGHQSLARPLPLAIIGVVAVLTAWNARAIARASSTDSRQLRAMLFLGLLLVFQAVHAGVLVATIGHFSHVTQHYYGWLFVTWFLWMGLLFSRLLQSRSGTAPSWAAPAAAVVLATLVFANAGIAGMRLTRHPDGQASLHNRRLPVMNWIARHVPPDARLAAWNAGQFGYFSGRTVVNLDGLANDREFLRLLETGGSILDYLRRERIEYLVDRNMPDLTMPYRASWDRRQLFHRSVPWANLEAVYVEANQVDPTYVLRVR
jgi:hypothetical protein